MLHMNSLLQDFRFHQFDFESGKQEEAYKVNCDEMHHFISYECRGYSALVIETTVGSTHFLSYVWKLLVDILYIISPIWIYMGNREGEVPWVLKLYK